MTFFKIKKLEKIIIQIFFIAILQNLVFSNIEITKLSQIESNDNNMNILPSNKEEKNPFTEFFLKNKLNKLLKFKDFFFQAKNNFKNHDDSFICTTCVNIFNGVNKFVKDHYGKSGIIEFADFICRNFIKISNEACKSYIGFYSPVIIESLLDHYFTGEYICNFHFICKYDHFKYLNSDDYATKIFKINETMVYDFEQKNENHVDLIDKNSSVWKVLHVSDIHTDLGYVEGSLGNCQDPVCCQNEDITNLKFLDKRNEIKQEDIAGHWGYMGKCDLPLRTTENFVDFIYSDINPDFIIWTGDNPSHAEWKPDNQEEALNITSLFSNMLKRINPRTNKTIPVYPSIGNHEKFPIDQFFPYDNSTERPLLKAIGDIWFDFLGEEAYSDFLLYGYYSKLHNGSNLRIVSYNCLLCDVVNFYIIKNPTDPNNQINWLENTLADAEKNGEIIYLIGHIPIGDSSFLSECSKRYQILLDRYSYIIRGHFSGHTHFDEIKIMNRYYNKDQISGMIYITPSLTTFSFLNPSFRVFEVDSKSKVIKDYVQYGFDLKEANSLENNKPNWVIRYRATELFNVDYISNYEKVKEFIMNIKSKKEPINNLLKAFFANGPLYETYINNKKFPLYIYCRVMMNNMEDYFRCIRYFSWDSEEFGFELLNLLSGKWYVRVQDEN